MTLLLSGIFVALYHDICAVAEENFSRGQILTFCTTVYCIVTELKYVSLLQVYPSVGKFSLKS